MYAVKPMSSAFKVHLSTGPAFRRAPAISRAGKNGVPRLTRVARSTFWPIRAVVNSDQNKATETAEKSVERKDVNGSLLVSPPTEKEGMVDVRAVITIRKKMKEKLVDKIEDQWEYFINGIGQGIMIQLISEEIDPG